MKGKERVCRRRRRVFCIKRLSSDADLSFVKVNVLFCAKVAREGHTVEISECLDDTRILNGPDVEEEDERGEENGG